MAAPNVPFYSDRLGMVSARNESAGRNDAINTNDLKGIHSYGKWQIYGTNIPAYLRSMSRLGGEYANIAARLGQYKVNSKAFDNAWRNEARAHPDLIENSQYQFIKATHYDPVLKKLSPDLQNAINSNRGLQEALWQATVLGPAAAKGLFNKGWKEGKGDIRKLVDVVYRDMHHYQRSYIKEHPDHLPILLKQHNVSRGIIQDILNDPKRNSMLVDAQKTGATPNTVPLSVSSQNPVSPRATALQDMSALAGSVPTATASLAQSAPETLNSSALEALNPNLAMAQQIMNSYDELAKNTPQYQERPLPNYSLSDLLDQYNALIASRNSALSSPFYDYGNDFNDYYEDYY